MCRWHVSWEKFNYQLHVVDNSESMWPLGWLLAVHGKGRNLIGAVQFLESSSKNAHSIMDHSRFCLWIKLGNVGILSSSFSHGIFPVWTISLTHLDMFWGNAVDSIESLLTLFPVMNSISQLVALWINETQTCDVWSHEFQLLKVNCVSVEWCYDVALNNTKHPSDIIFCRIPLRNTGKSVLEMSEEFTVLSANFQIGVKHMEISVSFFFC